MRYIYVLLLITASLLSAQVNNGEIMEEIEKGNFTKAENEIKSKLNDEDITQTEKLELMFELERMDRIRKDFTQTKQDVLDYVKEYYPDADEEKLKEWEADGSLEYKVIDGETLYFNRGAANLFRLNKDAAAKKIEINGSTVDKLDEYLEEYLPEVVNEIKETGKKYVKPVEFNLNYTITVEADAVPDGEIVRCWLPFPRESKEKQHSVKLISTSEKEYVVADNSHPQRTIYMEKKAVKGEQVEFNVKMSFTSANEWTKIDPEMVKAYDVNSELYKEYTAEVAPHIIFTDEVKSLSEKIVGDETNPYLKAKKIFTWISQNIPWAGAREYSTIRNISDYCIRNGHGDCGIKTITFITLCRYNGIPAKWESGWMLHPGERNLHDWGAFYLEGYGWLPVDQSFGLVKSDDEDVKYFYLGGMDVYRFVVNDAYSEPLYPAKIYPRSETVDFQRGEVEWRGGNLYFDQWGYNMEIEYSEK